MSSTPCPSCGATVQFRGGASILAVCEYCRTTLLRQNVDFQNIGQMAEVNEDGTPLRLAAEGKYGGTHFAVIGRIQYRCRQGFWNEWYLLFDDMRNGWLGEAQGIYTVSFLIEVSSPLPSFSGLETGNILVLNSRAYTIKNTETAVCIAGDGELPFRVGAGYDAPVADLAGEDDNFATIDYSEAPPLVFVGKYVDFDRLSLNGLRQFDGW